MSRFIDADFLIREIEKYNKENWHGMTWSSRMVATLLREAPKVDAVEVVRCNDCKYYKENEVVGHECVGIPIRRSMFGCDAIVTEPDDFCSYGERKE